MKAIVPAAGVGTRLRPITNTTPKALVQVGNRPIIGHILDRIVKAGINEVAIVIGYLGDLIREYVQSEYPEIKFDFIYQRETLGLGHAVWLCGDVASNAGGLFIIYGDTIVDGDFAGIFNTSGDGALGVKRVPDPERFGIVELEGDRIKRLVEKPQDFIGDLALIGVNYIKKPHTLFDSLNYIIENDIRTRGEIQITDAFQHMVENGADLKTFPIEEWFDCGKPEELISTNRHIIEQLEETPSGENCVFVPPVYIAPSASVKNSIIGPNVTIASEAVVERCVLSDTIVNSGAVVSGCNLQHSLIGIRAIINQPGKTLYLGDHASIEGSL